MKKISNARYYILIFRIKVVKLSNKSFSESSMSFKADSKYFSSNLIRNKEYFKKIIKAFLINFSIDQCHLLISSLKNYFLPNSDWRIVDIFSKEFIVEII